MDVEINQKTGKNISRHLNGIATRTQQVDSTNYNKKNNHENVCHLLQDLNNKNKQTAIY